MSRRRAAPYAPRGADHADHTPASRLTVAHVLGVAFGAAATLVEVRDAESGALAASGSTRHDEVGGDRHDPTVWWRSLAGAVAAAGEREIAAVSVCGSHPGLVLLDGAGAVLRPMQPWAQADASADARRLRSALGAQGWARATGALPGPTTSVSRLAWLRRREPQTFARVGAALLPHDWLTYRLSGRAVTDMGSASLTGVWSPTDGDWSSEVIDLVAPRGESRAWYRRLPEVLGPSERANWLAAPVYELLGLRGRPLVAPGTGEPMAVALALGIRPGRVGVSIGGSATAMAGLEQPVVDPSGEVRSRHDANGGHLALSSAASGHELALSLATLLDLSIEEMAELATDESIGRSRVLALPGVPGRAGAILTGLAGPLGRAELARAAFEGGACSALDALDRLLAADAAWDDDEPIRLAAPASGLAAHAQLMADLAGHPVLAAPGAPLAAAGACIQAAAVLQGADPLDVSDEWGLDGDEWYEPNEREDQEAVRAAHSQEAARQRRALREDPPD